MHMPSQISWSQDCDLLGHDDQRVSNQYKGSLKIFFPSDIEDEA